MPLGTAYPVISSDIQETLIENHNLWRSTVRTETHLDGLVLRWDRWQDKENSWEKSLVGRVLCGNNLLFVAIPICVPYNRKKWRQRVNNEVFFGLLRKRTPYDPALKHSDTLEHMEKYRDIQMIKRWSAPSLHHRHVLWSNVIQSPNRFFKELLKCTPKLQIFQCLQVRAECMPNQLVRLSWKQLALSTPYIHQDQVQTGMTGV